MASSTATTKLACGHFTDTTEVIQSDGSKTKCSQTCNAVLACGHNCQRKCFECHQYVKAEGIVTDHGTCERTCGQSLGLCPHRCMTRCHFGEPCPACTKPCEIRCQHRQCPLPCGTTCLPCSKPTCAVGCVHSRCSLPCAFPCDVEICSRRCDKILACGCQCPSSCPEPCPDANYCQNCSSEAVKNTIVDLFDWKAYKDVDLSRDPCIFPPCGHMITLSSLDGHMDMKTFYLLNEHGVPYGVRDYGKISRINDIKSCPSCRASLSTVLRYAHLLRRRDISQISNHHLDMYAQLAPKYHEIHERIRVQRSQSVGAMLPGVLYPDLGVPLDQLIKNFDIQQTTRYADQCSLYEKTSAALRKTSVDLQPYAFLRQILADLNLDASDMTVGAFQMARSSKDPVPICNQYRALCLEISMAILAQALNPYGYTNPQSRGYRSAKDLVCFNGARQDLADLYADAWYSGDLDTADRARFQWAGVCSIEVLFLADRMPKAPRSRAQAYTTQRITWLISLAVLVLRENAWRRSQRKPVYARSEQNMILELETFCHEHLPNNARLLHQLEHPYVLRYYYCDNKHYARLWNAFPMFLPFCAICNGLMEEERDWTCIRQNPSYYEC